MIRAAVTTTVEAAEELRARFVELAPEGFEDADIPGGVELAAYGEGAERIREAFPDAHITEVADGWEDGWRAFHRPVEIGALWVGPPWLEPTPGKTAIVIDPGQAFGTGAHATTRLCLELLLEREPGSLLDIGCGSGVLAIAAARLGFGPVVAVDFATAAVEATRENAVVNGVELEARELDALTSPLPAADLAVANIALLAVEALSGRVAAGFLITSGYLITDHPELAGFDHLDRRELDGWAADVFTAETR